MDASPDSSSVEIAEESAADVVEMLSVRARWFAVIAAVLLVLTAAATLQPAPGWDAAAAPTLRINVNTADAGTLQLLTGIGPALAGRMIEEREQQPFTSVEDLQRVSGIGPVISQRMAPHVAFRDQAE